MLIPKKRTALDGKIWWCGYDILLDKWSTDVRIGKYKTKKQCQYAIDKASHIEVKCVEHTSCYSCFYKKLTNGRCSKGLRETPYCRSYKLSTVNDWEVKK